MGAMQTVDRQAFLTTLRRSGLLAEDVLGRVLPDVPDAEDSPALARHLVERGLLTSFQAGRLLAGSTGGLHLGPYRILEKVGRGGMGAVFKAEHRGMGRVVAIKLMAPLMLETSRARVLFLREVRAMARLSHPNIVAGYDANEVGEHCYLVLEYVDGPNLKELVAERGPLPVGLACAYVRQAAAGLQCAHEQGMVHRDIKPGNLLLQRRGPDPDAPGLVKISDFGLARLHPPGTRDSQEGTILSKENLVMGTPDYLSPEQSRNLHLVDIRGDLYSLGCTFYYLLTGLVPFPGGSAVDKLIRHCTEPPPRVGAVRDDVPAPVAKIVERLLAKRPGDRYQTPAELMAALGPFVAAGGPAAPRQPKPAAPVSGGETQSSPCTVLDAPSADPDVAPLRPEAPPVTAGAPARRGPLVRAAIAGGLLLGLTVLGMLWAGS